MRSQNSQNYNVSISRWIVAFYDIDGLHRLQYNTIVGSLVPSILRDWTG